MLNRVLFDKQPLVRLNMALNNTSYMGTSVCIYLQIIGNSDVKCNIVSSLYPIKFHMRGEYLYEKFVCTHCTCAMSTTLVHSLSSQTHSQPQPTITPREVGCFGNFTIHCCLDVAAMTWFLTLTKKIFC